MSFAALRLRAFASRTACHGSSTQFGAGQTPFGAGFPTPQFGAGLPTPPKRSTEGLLVRPGDLRSLAWLGRRPATTLRSETGHNSSPYLSSLISHPSSLQSLPGLRLAALAFPLAPRAAPAPGNAGGTSSLSQASIVAPSRLARSAWAAARSWPSPMSAATS
jgi:hypothetical protein